MVKSSDTWVTPIFDANKMENPSGIEGKKGPLEGKQEQAEYRSCLVLFPKLIHFPSTNIEGCNDKERRW